jgi:geranylgeranyl diphosphate synthase type 3
MSGDDTANGKKESSTGHQFDESLLESFRYIQAIPGKDVRGKMIDCFNIWLQIEKTDLIQKVKSIVSDLHNASLLVDDIEDRSTLRRGVPVAHSVFGVPVVINTANYMYFAALEKCHSLQEPACMQIFVTELLNLHRGQGHDIQWREDFACPSESEYLNMILDKTGGLFRLAIGLMQPFCNKQEKPDFVELINNLSIYFQIRDDLLNLVDPDFFLLKTFAEDLTEGKFSLPVVHSIQSTEKGKRDTRLIAILRQKTNEEEVKRFAINIMRETGSLKYSRDACQVYKEKSLKEIERLGGNPALVRLIELLDLKLHELDAPGILTQTSDSPTKAASML